MIEEIRVTGYKSIRDVNLRLGALNALIGPNGAGKSNFISVFKFLNQLVQGNLQVTVAQGGGADLILHHGRRTTPKMEIEVIWDASNAYRCALVPTVDGRLVFADERNFHHKNDRDLGWGRGHSESRLADNVDAHDSVLGFVLSKLQSFRLYHFHDTSDVATVKQLGEIQNNWYLLPDASNLAAFLYRLRQTHRDRYDLIVRTVQLAAPFLREFQLAPNPLNPAMINLQWIEAGAGTPFTAYQLSDGTLRFICLATLLLQPSELMPATVLIDEPELGLHPYAIGLLAAMLQKAASSNQVIVATQSVPLIDQLTPRDIIVVDRAEGHSIFQRLNVPALESWLQSYTLGQLWQKNILGGRPHGPVPLAVEAPQPGLASPLPDEPLVEMPDWSTQGSGR